MKQADSLRGIELAKKNWSRLFISTDPFGWPFAKFVQHGRVLFPTDGCHLDRAQFDALSKAMTASGQDSFWIVIIEGMKEANDFAGLDFIQLNASDFDSYAGLHLTLENALFSTQGDWGLQISHEFHAVLGGSQRFMSDFDREYPFAGTQWTAFKSEWRKEQDQGWLAALGEHLSRP